VPIGRNEQSAARPFHSQPLRGPFARTRLSCLAIVEESAPPSRGQTGVGMGSPRFIAPRRPVGGRRLFGGLSQGPTSRRALRAEPWAGIASDRLCRRAGRGQAWGGGRACRPAANPNQLFSMLSGWRAAVHRTGRRPEGSVTGPEHGRQRREPPAGRVRARSATKGPSCWATRTWPKRPPRPRPGRRGCSCGPPGPHPPRRESVPKPLELIAESTERPPHEIRRP